MLVSLVLVAAACSGGSSDRPVVVATVWPLAWLAEEIVPGADVRMVPRSASADPHAIELAPSEVLAVRDAAVVLYVGDVGYQPAVEEAVASARGKVIALLEPGDDVDPHVWHRPRALVDVIGDMVGALADRSVLDLERIVELPDELTELQVAGDALLRGCPLEEVVVSHAGYGPLLEDVGVEQHAIAGRDAHDEPTARRLGELTQLIAARELPAVLAEPDEGREAAVTLADRTGVDLLDVRPLGTVTAEEAERGYFALYRENVVAFATALGCEV